MPNRKQLFIVNSSRSSTVQIEYLNQPVLYFSSLIPRAGSLVAMLRRRSKSWEAGDELGGIPMTRRTMSGLS
jgi:hypothetical protein